jgi:probable HAF family extracellular repeat protein
MNFTVLVHACIVGLFAVNAQAQAQQYTVTDLGTLGGNFSAGYGINAPGQVTGYSATSNAYHAFLYSNGSMQDLGTLWPASTNAASRDIELSTAQLLAVCLTVWHSEREAGRPPVTESAPTTVAAYSSTDWGMGVRRVTEGRDCRRADQIAFSFLGLRGSRCR